MSDTFDFTLYINKLLNDGLFNSEIKQINTKSLLNELKVDSEIRWNYLISRLVRNLTAINYGIVENYEHVVIDNKDNKIRLIARIWEDIAKINEGISSYTAFINSALLYDIAGYQANAVCLSKKITRDYYDMDVLTINDLIGLFLQRLFLQLKKISYQNIIEPESLTYEDEIYSSINLALISDAFYNISLFFLSGSEDSLRKSIERFTLAYKINQQLGNVVETNMILSIISLIPKYKERSTWSILSQMLSNDKWTRYLKLLARGTGSLVFTSPSISELWNSQIYALENGLLSDDSKIVKMPTSAGKTLVAEIAIAHTLISEPGSKCIYIAPYRALCWELEQTFLNIFGDLGFNVSTVSGSYETDDFETNVITNSDILVVTPEKLDLIQRINAEYLENVRLFILDEVQIVHEERGGIKFDLLLTRLKKKLTNARFISLSAVIPRQSLEDLSNWFRANSERDIIEGTWRPAKQRVALFRWRGTRGELSYFENETDPNPQFVPNIIEQTEYRYRNIRTGRINRRRFPDPHSKAQTCAELAVKLVELGPVLVFCPQKNFVEATANAISLKLDYMQKTNKVTPIALNEDTSRYSYQVAREWLGETHDITKLLRHGIAVHHGDIPDSLRKAIEKDIREKTLNIIIATNTLAQGVNLPIRTVIIHSIWRHNPDGPRVKLAARDYWNIAGRAGRAGRETEGTIIHVTKSHFEERDFFEYLSLRKNVEPVESALLQLLQRLTDERLSQDVIDMLDPEILALLVEEELESINDENVSEILHGTLVQIQSERLDIDIEPLHNAFIESSTYINNTTSNRAFWPIFSSTGLSSTSCESLQEYISSNREQIDTLFRNATERDYPALISLFLESCGTIVEMHPDREYEGSYDELLSYWIDGLDINVIINEFKEYSTSEQELSKFIENYFGYKLPWGISAFIKLANEILDIDSSELSQIVTYFPSMVKFGVPTPFSAWAMTIGIPSREIAIRLGGKFNQVAVERDYVSFIEWIGDIDSEVLRQEYSLTSPLLENVSRIITRATPNEFVREYNSITEILPMCMQIKGIAYEGRRILAQSIIEGMELEISRDYENYIDRNAILVTTNNNVIGYLDWKIAQLAAVDIDCGLELGAKVNNIVEGTVPQIEIELYEKE